MDIGDLSWLSSSGDRAWEGEERSGGEEEEERKKEQKRGGIIKVRDLGLGIPILPILR